MFKVKILKIYQNESSKFNPDSTEMERPVKASVRFDDIWKTVMHLQNQDYWLISDEQKQRMTKGINFAEDAQKEVAYAIFLSYAKKVYEDSLEKELVWMADEQAKTTEKGDDNAEGK